MPKVSVVVPVYNVELYLKRCLDSLVYQTLKDIEIVVVDDGSTDNSWDIINHYAKSYPKKVFAYQKKNGGLSDARNYGIERCHGDFIGFVDSDDYADLDMFEKLYNKAISKNFDVTVCDIRLVYDNTSKEISSKVETDLFSKEDIKMQMIDIYPTAWNKLYKKELFDNVLFKKGVWYEDVEFLYRLFPYINSIGTIKVPLINYTQRVGAISKTFDKRIYNYIDNWNDIVLYYKENDFYDEYFEELEFCYVRYLYMTFIKSATHFDKKNYKMACKIAKENVLSHFPNYKKNKYLKGLSSLYVKHFNLLSTNLIYLYYHYFGS